MAPDTLNADEEALVRAVEGAQPMDFEKRRRPDGSPGVLIRAIVIRNIMLGLPLPVGGQSARAVFLPPTGVRIRHARIDGGLDIQDGAAGDGRPLPPLALENCIIPEPIALSRVHLRHLSLASSRFNEVMAQGARIDGPVDLTFVRSAQEDGRGSGCDGLGLCWADFEGAWIDGRIDAWLARFVAPPPRADRVPRRSKLRRALNLAGSRVHGSIWLTPKVYALGGVSLATATVDGDVRCDGSRFVGLEAAAFDASTAHIGGFVALRALDDIKSDTTPFTAKGEVRFFRAVIRNVLDMAGAHIEAGTGRSALSLGGAAVGGPIALRDWKGRKGGRPHTFRFRAEGRLDLIGVNLDGDLEMNAASIRARRPEGERGPEPALDLSAARIHGSILMEPADCWIMGERSSIPFESVGQIDLTGAEIVQALRLSGASLKADGREAMMAPDARVGRDLSLENATIVGEVNLEDAKVTDSLLLTAADLSAHENQFSVRAGGITIGRNLDLSGKGRSRLITRGTLQFDTATIGGEVKIDNLEFVADADGSCPGLSLIGARIGRKLTVRRLETWIPKGAEAQLARFVSHGGRERFLATIDLRGMKVDELDDDSGKGWGSGVLLKLDGFQYGRLTHDGNASRENWLSLQYPERRVKRELYAPDAYEHLARVLRASGDLDEAKKITRLRMNAERRVTRSWLTKLMMGLYHRLFDYGLSPPIAVFTLSVCLLVGAVGAYLADGGWNHSNLGPLGPWITPVHTRSALVITVKTANAAAAWRPDQHQLRAVLYRIGKADAAPDEAPCGRLIDPALYAVDVFIPLDFGQESRCSVSEEPWAWGWRIAKAIYAVIGWIVTSITLLTISGILRRQAEG